MRQSKSVSSLATWSGKRVSSKGALEAEKVYPVRAEDYQLLEDCGRGVSAVVYQARCKANSDLVAIKAIYLESLSSPLEDIMHEAQTMKAYKHEAILPLYCSFVHGDQLWMVMPYMEGGSVAHIMRYRFPDGLQEMVTATIMKEVLRALAYVHCHGGIHRDVKAGNVLVDAEGHVKLGDFGVSATMEREGDWGCGTRKRLTFVGTPCWMAPEVLEQTAGYGYAADIWSFGITMLEMAHGHAPFSKLPPMKVLLMTLQGPPPQLEENCGGRHFSKGMREVVARCLNKDPTKRPTAKELLEHRFFKQARDSDFLKKVLLAGLPPLPERVKEIRAGKAATRGKENDRAAVASHISYIADVAQWDFNCCKDPSGICPIAPGVAIEQFGSRPDTQPGSSRDRDQQQEQYGQQPSAALPSLAGQDSQQQPGGPIYCSVNGLESRTNELKQYFDPQYGGDVGAGAKDKNIVGRSGYSAAADSAGAPGAATPADSGKHAKLACFTGGKQIVAFPVSIPTTPEESPDSSRPPTPDPFTAAAAQQPQQASTAVGEQQSQQAVGGAPSQRPSSPAARASAVKQGVSDGPAAAAPVAPARPSTAGSTATAKKHGRFMIIEGSAPYQGPELDGSNTTNAAAAASSSTASTAAAGKDDLHVGSRQRSVSSPDMGALAAFRSACGAEAAAKAAIAARDAAVKDASIHQPASTDMRAAGLLAPGEAPAGSQQAQQVVLKPNSSSVVTAGRADHTAPAQAASTATGMHQPAAAGLAAAAEGSDAAPEHTAADSTPRSGIVRKESSQSNLLSRLLPQFLDRRQPSPLQHHQHHQHHRQQFAPASQSESANRFARYSSPVGHDATAKNGHSAIIERVQSSPAARSGGSADSSNAADAAVLARPAAALTDIYPQDSNSGSGVAASSLARPGAALTDIYPQLRSDNPVPARVQSPSRWGGGSSSSGGRLEHHNTTAAQVWDQVKEVCAEAVEKVAQPFKAAAAAASAAQSPRHSSPLHTHSFQQQLQQQQPMVASSSSTATGNSSGGGTSSSSKPPKYQHRQSDRGTGAGSVLGTAANPAMQSGSADSDAGAADIKCNLPAATGQDASQGPAQQQQNGEPLAANSILVGKTPFADLDAAVGGLQHELSLGHQALQSSTAGVQKLAAMQGAKVVESEALRSADDDSRLCQSSDELSLSYQLNPSRSSSTAGAAPDQGNSSSLSAAAAAAGPATDGSGVVQTTAKKVHFASLANGDGICSSNPAEQQPSAAEQSVVDMPAQQQKQLMEKQPRQLMVVQQEHQPSAAISETMQRRQKGRFTITKE